jgi:hypothetical protein
MLIMDINHVGLTNTILRDLDGRATYLPQGVHLKGRIAHAPARRSLVIKLSVELEGVDGVNEGDGGRASFAMRL